MILSCAHNNSRAGGNRDEIPLSSQSMAKGVVRCRWLESRRRFRIDPKKMRTDRRLLIEFKRALKV